MEPYVIKMLERALRIGIWISMILLIILMIIYQTIWVLVMIAILCLIGFTIVSISSTTDKVKDEGKDA